MKVTKIEPSPADTTETIKFIFEISKIELAAAKPSRMAQKFKEHMKCCGCSGHNCHPPKKEGIVG